MHVISWLCQLSSNIYKCQEAPEKSTKAGEPHVVGCACPPLLQEGRFLPLWEVAADYDLCINPHSLSPQLSPSQPRTINPAPKGEDCWWDTRPGRVLLGAGTKLRVCCLQLAVAASGLLQYICLPIGLLFLCKESLALILSCCSSSL